MATRVQHTGGSGGTRVTPYGASTRPGPGSGGWETFSWYFFRVSGVALVVLALLHLVLMHVANDVSSTTYEFVAKRYANPFWRAYDLLLLKLGFFHVVTGLLLPVDDYIPSRAARLAVQSVLFLTAIGFWLVGTLTIITFQPSQTAVQPLLRLVAGW